MIRIHADIEDAYIGILESRLLDESLGELLLGEVEMLKVQGDADLFLCEAHCLPIRAGFNNIRV